MGYFIFAYIDYPLFELVNFFGMGLGVIFFGGAILWSLYGFALQALFAVRSRKGLILLATSLLGIAVLFAFPGLLLATKPDWETHILHGEKAAAAGKTELAIEHFIEALQLIPKDEYSRADNWDYLGNLYMEKKDYGNAEKAFSNALEIVVERPNSRPSDFVDRYHRLAWFYKCTGNKQLEKHHLEEEIEYMSSHKGFSVQEPECWHRLAEIAFASGDHATARELQLKAIEMDRNSPLQLEESTRWKKQLSDWGLTF
jgi:tetratricopeptide (TPR) repeat protein